MNDSLVAYFSMEIGLEKDIKTYSGGLGILAGDTVKSNADVDSNFVGVTLLYRKGFMKQEIDENGWQQERPDPWNPDEKLEKLDSQVTVEIKGEKIDVAAWKRTVTGIEGEVDVLFLDTDLESNSDYARKITDRLYLGGQEYRLAQEAVLGIAGKRMLDELGLNPRKYHMNEGHSSLLVTELLMNMSEEEVKNKLAFTTHTPVPAGHDVFYEDNVEKILTDRKSLLREKGFYKELNTTKLALKYSSYNNAVSKKHEEVSNEMFPDQDIDYITNGVHSFTWTSKYFQDLFDKEIPLWRENPDRLSQAKKLKDNEVWKAHMKSKKELKNYVESVQDKQFDAETFTIGFARRATGYKRATLIFQDLEKLERLSQRFEGLQIVMAGKAHPDDTQGKKMIQKLFNYMEMLENVDLIFIPEYNMETGLRLVSGVDLWLNNPKRGKEASGTSGMKAAHNGIPQLSVLDGWWLEGHIEDKTGWSIGEEYVQGEDEDEVDSKSIYRKLEKIMALYQDERQEWIEIMKNCITSNASYFNTQRMVEEYITQAYK